MKRPKQHVMEDQSVQLLKQLIPDKWIARPIHPPDYGVDLEIELVDQKVVTGKRIWVQMKAIEQTKFRAVSHGPENGIDCIPFPLSTKQIRYSLECSFPLLLFIADLRSREIYWLPIRDEVTTNLNKRAPNWREQKSNTLLSQVGTVCPASEETTILDFDGTRWNPPVMYAFVLLHHLTRELQYSARLSGYRIGDGWIDDGEEEELRTSLGLARQSLSIALGLDILFGKNLAGEFVVAVVNIKRAIHDFDAALSLLKSREYSTHSLEALLRNVSQGVEMLSTIINMLPYVLYAVHPQRNINCFSDAHEQIVKGSEMTNGIFP